jgi:hypothetical protein
MLVSAAAIAWLTADIRTDFESSSNRVISPLL